MKRIPEVELMDDDEQARAYNLADFAEPHNRFVELFLEKFPDLNVNGTVLDLGCGPADIGIRFARAFPACRLHGLDGAAAMLKYGAEAVRSAGLMDRIELIQAYLPGAVLPLTEYDGILSNSLLHHLEDPGVLWRTVRASARPGAFVFVMDLMRPASRQAAEELVQTHSSGERAILRRDFLNSLCAAYRPDEARQQLAVAGLENLRVEAVSDRHLLIYGIKPAD